MYSNLSNPCLVLNKSWLPITAISVKSSIRAAYIYRAYIVDPQDYSIYTFTEWMCRKISTKALTIMSTQGPLQCPEIIILSQFNTVPCKTLLYSRRNVWIRDNYCCQYCMKKIKKSSITIDHIIPKSKGGKTNFENCVASCAPCNRKKDNRTLKQAGMLLKKIVIKGGQKSIITYTKPCKPRWSVVYGMKNNSQVLSSWKKFL